MMRLIGASLGAATLALAGMAQAHDIDDGSGVKLTATLTGAAEAPGPGDSDGTGTFSGRVNPGKGELCYTLTAKMIATATAAHVHKGAKGAAGAVVVPLVAPTSGSSETCSDISKELAMALIKSPQDYYINVHNAEFPSGAIRGQLMK